MSFHFVPPPPTPTHDISFQQSYNAQGPPPHLPPLYALQPQPLPGSVIPATATSPSAYPSPAAFHFPVFPGPLNPMPHGPTPAPPVPGQPPHVPYDHGMPHVSPSAALFGGGGAPF